MLKRRGLGMALIALCIIGTGGIVGWRHYADSPQYALRQIQVAARTHNRLKFEQFVDLQRLTTTTIDEIMARTTLASVDSANSGFAVLGAAIGAGMIERLKPALASEMRSAILHAVEQGRMDSILTTKKDTAAGPDLTLASVARNASIDRIRFEGFDKVEAVGDIATVALRLRNERFDTTLTLRVRLERGPHSWRVVAPDNLGDYLKTVEDLQKRRLAEANNNMRQAMSEMVSIGDVHRRVVTYLYYSDDVVITVPITNTGHDTLSAVILELDANGSPIDRSDLALGLVTPLAPGHSGTAKGVLDYNRYIDWHRTIRYSDALTARPWAVITRNGATADTLVEYTSWSDYVSRN